MGIVDGTTSLLVRSALDALSMRHSVISNNIANANSPDFRPKVLEFERQLHQALLNSTNTDIESHLIKSFNKFEEELMNGSMIKESNDKTVELDAEMARLTDTLLRYQALLEGLNKRSSVLKMAISEGRG